MSTSSSSRRIIGILAFTQVASWGSMYYAFSVLASDIQREFGWRTEIIFGAFSWSLLVAGVVSTPAGMLLDRLGGRSIMGIGSLLSGAGLGVLALSQSILQYFIGWTICGIAMALVLYEAAFATINREVLQDARKAISIVTLFGGLASTVFWPLTLQFHSQLGWRDTYLVYAAIHLLACAPLHALLPASPKLAVHAVQHEHAVQNYTLREAVRHPAFWKLAFAFATNTFIFASLSVHLIPTLQRFGHSVATAVFMATLIGPMQVAGRIGEMAFAHRVLPQTVGKLTFAVLPAALLAFIFMGKHQMAVAAFCMLYGMSNGVLTIVRGTVPQALFGRQNYGAIAGALASPSLVAKATGPLAIAALIEAFPAPQWMLAVLLLASALSFASYISAVRATPADIGLPLERK